MTDLRSKIVNAAPNRRPGLLKGLKKNSEFQGHMSIYPCDWPMPRKVFHWLHLETKEIPKCIVCKNDMPWKNPYNKNGRCSATCRNNDPVWKKKYQDTCQIRYGVDFASQNPDFRKQVKATLIERYGVDNPMKSPAIRITHEASMFEKYGFKNIFEDSQYIQKAFLEKHGVMSPMHDADILDKVLKSRYRWKPFVLPDGTTILLQGNEPWAMAALLEIYSQDAIAYDKKTIPVVYYQYESKRSRYFPDFYIPSKNLIIEVKSEYTYLSDLSRNQAKEAACLNQGYLFEFWVYDRKGNKVNHLTSKLV